MRDLPPQTSLSSAGWSYRYFYKRDNHGAGTSLLDWHGPAVCFFSTVWPGASGSWSKRAMLLSSLIFSSPGCSTLVCLITMRSGTTTLWRQQRPAAASGSPKPNVELSYAVFEHTCDDDRPWRRRPARYLCSSCSTVLAGQWSTTQVEH